MSESKTTEENQPDSIVVGGMHGSGKNIARKFLQAMGFWASLDEIYPQIRYQR